MSHSESQRDSAECSPITAPDSAIARWRIHVTGIVQGIGFRPFVYRLAHHHKLKGWVLNAADGVTLEIEGPPESLQAFWDDFHFRRPPGAVYESVQRTEIPPQPPDESGFRILPSRHEGVREPNIPPDLATCAECLRELWDPRDRRYRYPFINCTHCGPRWSIIEGVPYDRPLTSMKIFPMCPACRREYEEPLDRRFHAQPVACPVCGPEVQLLSRDGTPLARGDAAVRAAAEAVRRGQILAFKGLGGFQLICDAGQPRAVEELRRRKRRPDKPFAIMLTEQMLEQLCAPPSAAAKSWLHSPYAPIVLLRRRSISVPIEGTTTLQECSSSQHRSTVPSATPHPQAAPPETDCRWQVCEAVAPGNPYLGVMLPYTPLHHLLMEAINRPIVCTSGNLSEEPMAIEDADARTRLGSIADVFLVHNRPIVRPVDDSVLAEGAPGDVFVIRRARGFAPRPIRLGMESPTILATGGHLKNVVALAMHQQVILSAHIGDLDNVLAWGAHRRAIEDLLRFFQAVPEAIACDLHPDYASTRTAQELAARLRVPLYRWQHHVAHFAACLAEWERMGSDLCFDAVAGQMGDPAENRPEAPSSPPEPPLLGVIWDGTGYGVDGTVWGGEFFLYDGRSFRRIAHLRSFCLPGGEVVVRQPRRSLLGLLIECECLEEEMAPGGVLRQMFEEAELRLLLQAVSRGVQSPRTSSMGRLFDGVAALLGLGAQISFEGQAAMALQFVAEEAFFGSLKGPGSLESDSEFEHRRIDTIHKEKQNVVLPITIVGKDPLILDWQPLVKSLLNAVRAGVSRSQLALGFHQRLVEATFELAAVVKPRGILCAGGCFQNQLLRRLIRREGKRRGLPVWLARRVPPGDGGIALGQVWLTSRWLRGEISAGQAGVLTTPRSG